MFVTASQCSDQIAFCQQVVDEEVEQHSIENHSLIAQWVAQLTSIQEIAGSIPTGEQIFFFGNQYFLHTRFF